MLALSTPVKFVKRVGERVAEELGRRGVETVEDLLYHLPFRYEDRLNPRPIADLTPGAMASVIGEVRGTVLLRTRGAPIFEMTVGQGLSSVKCMWFNGSYLRERFKPGQMVALYGVVEASRSGAGKLKMIQPQFEILPGPGDKDDGFAMLEVGRIVPVYETLGGTTAWGAKLTSRWLRRVVWGLFEEMGVGIGGGAVGGIAVGGEAGSSASLLNDKQKDRQRHSDKQEDRQRQGGEAGSSASLLNDKQEDRQRHSDKQGDRQRQGGEAGSSASLLNDKQKDRQRHSDKQEDRQRQGGEQEGELGDETLPGVMRLRLGLPGRLAALRSVHFPEAGTPMVELMGAATAGHRRLIFEEFFYLELGLELKRRRMRDRIGTAFVTNIEVREALKQVLPFKPTAAQKRVLGEIAADMREVRPMRRLLQGDVGSGKTIVAMQAALVAIENGYQVAMMAPTEILATQHYLSARKLLAEKISPRTGRAYRVGLLTGSLDTRTKREAQGRIMRGETQLAIGTHALIEEKVEFDNLGLVIVDEQHRFGVEQRFKLMRKPNAEGEAQEPDVLVMTATPIPRTLALTLYGDMDASVIDELPPGRSPIVTRRVTEAKADEVWGFVRKQVAAGRQAYVVYPVIEGAKEDQAELDFAREEHEGTGEREQGTGNREQRAGDREQKAVDKASSAGLTVNTGVSPLRAARSGRGDGGLGVGGGGGAGRGKGTATRRAPLGGKGAGAGTGMSGTKTDSMFPKAKLRAATEMYEELRGGALKGLRVGLLHGRLSAADKEVEMRRFQRGETDVLIATTVIEVGVDVANATLMVIEHAERFGLAQMHQLRGRVGRGSAKSYCILMTGGAVSEAAEERMAAMERTQDGFELAEIDLAQRGPGEFFGTRQAGAPELRVANLLRDRAVLELAKREAAAFTEGAEAGTSRGEIEGVWARLKVQWQRRYGLVEA